MKTLHILLLADDKPGHFHLSEGVILAMQRRALVEVTRLEVQRSRFFPSRVLAKFLAANLSPRLVLKLAYGVNADRLPLHCDVVISAGGNTLAANIAAARALGAENIFLGSLRQYQPFDFGLVITSYERFAPRPRHMVALKPNKMDPDALNRPAVVAGYSEQHPPKVGGLLLGGDSAEFKFSDDEWRTVLRFIMDIHQKWGTLWQVSTSRRTPGWVADDIADIAAKSPAIDKFIDYRSAGPGTLPSIFASADIILCTEDSSTMISEGIAARLPIFGLTPTRHGFTPQEAEYRDYLQKSGWTCSLAIAGLGSSRLAISRLAAALAGVKVMEENHIDVLAQRLEERLPALFSD